MFQPLRQTLSHSVIKKAFNEKRTRARIVSRETGMAMNTGRMDNMVTVIEATKFETTIIESWPAIFLN